MRRPTEWFGWSLADVDIGSAPYVGTIMSTSDFASFTKPTITRVVGDLTLRLNVRSTIEAQATSIFAGLGVFDDDAVPSPENELDRGGWQWTGSDLMWAPELQLLDGYTGNPYQAMLNGFRKIRFNLDVRAQRIVGPHQELKLVVNYHDELGEPDNPFLTGHLRVLVKE